MYREGTALTSSIEEKFSIIRHCKVKQVLFRDVPVFPLTSVNSLPHNKVALNKGFICIFIHLSRFIETKVETAFVP